jgi:hypothetical protein
MPPSKKKPLLVYQTWVGRTEMLRLTISPTLLAQVAQREEGKSRSKAQRKAQLSDEHLATLRKYLNHYGFFERAKADCVQDYSSCKERFVCFLEDGVTYCLGCDCSGEETDDDQTIFAMLDALSCLVWRHQEGEEEEMMVEEF